MLRPVYTLAAGLFLLATVSAGLDFAGPGVQLCNASDREACATSGADCMWQPVLGLCARVQGFKPPSEDDHARRTLATYSCDDQDGMQILFDDLNISAPDNTFGVISEGYRGFEWGENYFGLFGAWLNSVAGLAYPGAANAAADGYLYSTLGTAFVFNRTDLPSQRFSARFFIQPIEHCHFRPGSIVLYAMYGGRGMDVNITGYLHGTVTRSRAIPDLPNTKTLVDLRRLGEVDMLEIVYFNGTNQNGDGDSIIIPEIVLLPVVPIDSIVKKLAVCLPSNAGVFETVPGYGCNGLDDDCAKGPDDCMEDKYKPTFTSHPADLAKTWATSEEEAHAILQANLTPEDDCTPSNDLHLHTSHTGQCANTTWTVMVHDKCGNMQTTTVVLPYDDHEPVIRLSSDITKFTRIRLKPLDIGFHMEVEDDCSDEEVQVVLQIFSDEGYAADYTKPWRSSFAMASEVRDSTGAITGFEVFLLPQAWKTCHAMLSQVCVNQGPSYSRHYVIRAHVTDAAGHTAVKDHIVEVELGHRSLMVGTAALHQAQEQRERTLHDVNAGRMFLLTEISGVMIPHHH